MKARILILLGLIFVFALPSHCQDSTVDVKQFPGTTVGEKVSAAMLNCPANTAIPCILRIDPSLAAYPAGNMPALCSRCTLYDYRDPGSTFNLPGVTPDGANGIKVSGSVAAGTSVTAPQHCIGASCITAWPNPGVWGQISGTLSSQTDLQTALNGKAASNATTTLGSTTITLGASTTAVTGLTVDGVTPSTLGYLDATSSVQTQLNGKAASNATTTVNGTSCSLGASCTVSSASLVPMGAWNSTTAYAVGDLVSSGSNNFAAIQASTNQAPPASGSNAYWQQIYGNTAWSSLQAAAADVTLANGAYNTTINGTGNFSLNMPVIFGSTGATYTATIGNQNQASTVPKFQFLGETSSGTLNGAEWELNEVGGYLCLDATSGGVTQACAWRLNLVNGAVSTSLSTLLFENNAQVYAGTGTTTLTVGSSALAGNASTLLMNARSSGGTALYLSTALANNGTVTISSQGGTVETINTVTGQVAFPSGFTSLAVNAGTGSSTTMTLGNLSGTNSTSALTFQSTSGSGTTSSATMKQQGGFLDVSVMAAGVTLSSVEQLDTVHGYRLFNKGLRTFAETDIWGYETDGEQTQLFIGSNLQAPTGTTLHAVRVNTTFAQSAGNAAAGYDSQLVMNGQVNADHIIAFQARNSLQIGTGNTASNDYAFGAFTDITSGTATNLYDFYAQEWTGAGAVGTHYGLYLPAFTKATTNWEVYVAGGATYFGGNVQVGGGSSAVYRCTTAGTLPVGALTTTAANCGASSDSGLRLK